MVAALINLVVVLLIVGLIWWAVERILPLLPLPEPIGTVVRVILIVVLCIVVIYALLGLVPGSGYGWRLVH